MRTLDSVVGLPHNVGMATNDAARHGLYAQLEHVLGNDHARTLMSYLPRAPSEEIATKADIERLSERFDARFISIDERFDRLEAKFDRMEARFDRRFAQMDDRMDRMQRFYVGTTVWSMTALTGVFSLVVAFFG